MGPHQVPGEIGMAIMSQRPEFLALFRAKIERGELPTKEEMLGMCSLIEESIQDWRDLQELTNTLKERMVKPMRDTAKMIDHRADEFWEICDDLEAIGRVAAGDRQRLTKAREKRALEPKGKGGL